MQTTQTTGRIASPNTYTMYSIHTVISKFQFMSKSGGQKKQTSDFSTDQVSVHDNDDEISVLTLAITVTVLHAPSLRRLSWRIPRRTTL